MVRITLFLRNSPRPLVLTSSDPYDRVLRYIRKIMKLESGVLEIEIDNDTVFVEREDILLCLVSPVNSSTSLDSEQS